MLQNQKISQHKADIEKRIQDLESKLQNQTKSKELSKDSFNNSLPIRRIYAQKEEYFEPESVTVLRERQNNLDKRQIWHSGMKEKNMAEFGKIGKNMEEIENTRTIIYKEKDKENDNHDSLLVLEHRTEQLLNRHKSQIPENNELYGLVTQILEKQRNLEDEIGFLKSELSREQKGRKEELSTKKPEEKKYHIVSFQEQENYEKQPITEFHNNVEDDSETKELKLPDPNLQKAVMRNGDENIHKIQNFIAVKESEPDPKKIIERPRKSRNTISSSKKRTASRQQERQPDQMKIESLIKSQKSRNERLIVSEQCKSEFWKQVELRIRESSSEYNESFHRNNRFINDHLINTNELQKKVRDEVISKIYSQCNNCVYK